MGLEVCECRVGDIQLKQMWTSNSTGAIGRVCVPPLLAIRLDPACSYVECSDPVDVGAIEPEPIGVARLIIAAGTIDELLNIGDVLREV